MNSLSRCTSQHAGLRSSRRAGSVSSGPHRWEGLTVTLWEHAHEIPDAALAPADIASALKHVHIALTDYVGALPSFSVALDDARALLAPARSPALNPADRRFLLNAPSEFQTTAATPTVSRSRLHGSPHQANWLASADGPLLLDFETACHGPVEWDLAALDDDVAEFFPHANQALIASLRRLRSACVAAKCWVAPERAPEVGEAAQVHLKLLRCQPLAWDSNQTPPRWWCTTRTYRSFRAALMRMFAHSR